MLVDVQTVTVVIAGISVIIGVINSILSSRQAAKNDQRMLETRQAQLFAQLHEWWRSRDAMRAYGNVRFVYREGLDVESDTYWDDWMKRVNVLTNLEGFIDCMSLWFFFEGVGVLVKKGLIDVELVEDLFSKRIIWFWENQMGLRRGNIRHVDYLRQVMNDPTQYDSWEYLYNLMKQREKQQQATVST
jgi:hypothetical protein